MHSLLILIFISVSIFFFTLLGCVFPSHPLLAIPALFAHVLDCSLGLGWVRSCPVLCSFGLVPWMWLVSAIKWTNEGYKTIRFGFLSFRFVSFLLVAAASFASFGFLRAFFGSLCFFSRISILFIIICVWVGYILYPSYICFPFGFGHFICLYLANAKCFVSFLAGIAQGSRASRAPTGFGFRVRGFMLMLVFWEFLFGVRVCYISPTPSVSPSGFVLSCVLFM